MATSREIYNAPSYSVLEASWYLRMSDATLRTWVAGRIYPVSSGMRRSEAVIELADPVRKYLSFMNLVEAHVLYGIRRKHNIGLNKVREAVHFLRLHFNSRHPLIEHNSKPTGLIFSLKNSVPKSMCPARGKGRCGSCCACTFSESNGTTKDFRSVCIRLPKRK